MEICDYDHDPICFDDYSCPLCAAKEEIRDEIISDIEYMANDYSSSLLDLCKELQEGNRCVKDVARELESLAQDIGQLIENI